MDLRVEHDRVSGDIWFDEIWSLITEQGEEIAFVQPSPDGSFTPEMAKAAAYRFAASEKLLAACKAAREVLRLIGGANPVTMEQIDIAIAAAEGRLSPIIDRPG